MSDQQKKQPGAAENLEPGKRETIDFEKSLKALEEIVRQMEQGELTLENSLASFEEGVRLTKQCQTALQNAEQKVSQLIKNSDGQYVPTDFSNNSPS